MNDPATSPEAKFSESFAADYIQQTRVHLNFDQNVVIITEDRLELCLRHHLACMEARTRWIAPASLFIAFITALCTSTFHDAFNLKADVWQALFVFLTIASGLWSAFAIYQALQAQSSMRHLLQEIKKSANIASNQQQLPNA